MTAHFFGAVGYGDRLEGSTILEGLLSDGLDLATDSHGLEFSTVVERLVTDGGDIVLLAVVGDGGGNVDSAAVAESAATCSDRYRAAPGIDVVIDATCLKVIGIGCKRCKEHTCRKKSSFNKVVHNWFSLYIIMLTSTPALTKFNFADNVLVLPIYIKGVVAILIADSCV